jgi:glutamine synthetase
VCIRIPPARGEGTRLEHRMSDGAANPYLAAAAILHAARMGAEQDLDPPPPQVVSEAPATDRRVPATLALALDALEQDKELCSAMGEWLVQTFTMLKRAEWERYAAAVADTSTTEVTDWEREYYLPFF